MEFVLFPNDFLDFPEICDLSAEYKLIASFLAVHPRISAAAVTVATPYVVSQLPLPAEVFAGVVDELERRKILVADVVTREIFILASFHWHRAPTQGESSSWARQVAAATSRIASGRVRDAVLRALADAPPARLPSTKLPANCLTAMPVRAHGQAWTASETLAHFSFLSNPQQTAAGVYVPVMPAHAAFCSLPLQTLFECVESLAAARLLFFDAKTGEVFCPARLRAAAERDFSKVQATAEKIRSWSIFRAFAECAKRRFPKITLKSTCCPLGEFRRGGGESKGGESPQPRRPDLFGLAGLQKVGNVLKKI